MLWLWASPWPPCFCHCFLLEAFEQQGLTYTCAHIHPRRNTPENSWSLPWAVSVTAWTHKASLGPAPHRARPYIYPTLLLKVTNMGTGRREGVTQLSAHYVEWSLHSYDCICDCCPNKCLPLHLCPQPGVAECQIENPPQPLLHTLIGLSSLFIFTAHPLILCEVRFSWTRYPVSISILALSFNVNIFFS